MKAHKVLRNLSDELDKIQKYKPETSKGTPRKLKVFICRLCSEPCITISVYLTKEQAPKKCVWDSTEPKWEELNLK